MYPEYTCEYVFMECKHKLNDTMQCHETTMTFTQIYLKVEKSKF